MLGEYESVLIIYGSFGKNCVPRQCWLSQLVNKHDFCQLVNKHDFFIFNIKEQKSDPRNTFRPVFVYAEPDL